MLNGSRRRAAVLTLALPLALGLVGCGSSTGPTSQPTPIPGPSQANITVTCSAYTVSGSPIGGFAFRLSVPCTIRETAGLGANLNYVRLRLLLGGSEVERQEIGASDIIRAAGTNRVAANGTVNGNFIFDFNRGDATSAILDFNFTDDRGNNATASFTLV